MESEVGEAINVCAADAICAAALGESYSGTDHAADAVLLERVEPDLGKKLRSLIALKPGAHYGNALLTPGQRQNALRASRALVEEARLRTT